MLTLFLKQPPVPSLGEGKIGLRRKLMKDLLCVIWIRDVPKIADFLPMESSF